MIPALLWAIGSSKYLRKMMESSSRKIRIMATLKILHWVLIIPWIWS